VDGTAGSSEEIRALRSATEMDLGTSSWRTWEGLPEMEEMLRRLSYMIKLASFSA